jgi:hypothetical protein
MKEEVKRFAITVIWRLVQCAVVEIAAICSVGLTSAEMAGSKAVALWFLGDCRLAVIVVLSVHAITYLGLVLVLADHLLHHSGRTRVGKIIKHSHDAFIRFIDRI